MADEGEDARRCTVVSDYWRKRLNLRDLRDGTAWENLNNAKDSAETKDNLKPLQSGGEMTGEVICPYGNEHGSSILATEARPRDRSWAEMTDGEIIGEVLGPFDNEHFIVEASCGSRYYCRSNLDKEKITCGSRVVVDMTTSTIMRAAPLPEEVDPVVVVRDQMRQLRELVELPLRHPDLLRSLGIKPPGEKLLPPSCLEKSSPADCPRSIAARNGHTERCPRATTAQKEIVDCSGKDRKRIGVVVFSRIKVVPRITCKLSKKK